MDNSKAMDIDWSTERIIPAFQALQHLKIYDMRGVSQEIQLTVATLVGLINRSQPQIYLISRNNDGFWLKEVLSSIPQDFSNLTGEAILEELLTFHQHSIHGFIIYVHALKDSINI